MLLLCHYATLTLVILRGDTVPFSANSFCQYSRNLTDVNKGVCTTSTHDDTVSGNTNSTVHFHNNCIITFYIGYFKSRVASKWDRIN